MPVSKKAMDFLEMLQAASLEQYGYVPEDWVNDVDENAEKIEENIHVNVEANLMYYLQTLQQLSPDLDISKFHTLKMPDSVVSGSKEFLAKIRNDPASFFQDKANQLLIDIYLRDIKDVNVGDILENDEEVYGIVEINGKNIDEQFEYNLGKDLVVEGTSNLLICDKKINEFINF